MAAYDELVHACLDTSPLTHCIIDVHNYGRWNGEIIGQPDEPAPDPTWPEIPSDQAFTSLWSQLANHYAAANDYFAPQARIIFGMMHAPHDMKNMTAWASLMNRTVATIRGTEAWDGQDNWQHAILLPMSVWSTALTDYSAMEAVFNITGPSGLPDNLYLDLQIYLDRDDTGTHAECVTDNMDKIWAISEILRAKGRVAFVSQTGAVSAKDDHDDAGAESLCMQSFCQEIDFIKAQSDVFLGLTAWAAGSYGPDYMYSLTPGWESNRFVDGELLRRCVLGDWYNTEDDEAYSSHNPTTTITEPTTSSSTLAPFSPTLTTATITTVVTSVKDLVGLSLATSVEQTN